VFNITQGAAIAFLKSIVYRFGVPNRIITDNITQFTSRIFQEYCEGIGTQLCFASVAHPRSNGQAEKCECSRGTEDSEVKGRNGWRKCESITADRGMNPLFKEGSPARAPGNPI
jgi:transposase InsO family protein